jgi:hypothetical protein
VQVVDFVLVTQHNLAAQGLRRGKHLGDAAAGPVLRGGRHVKQWSQHLAKDCRLLALALVAPAVVLEGEDDGVGRGSKGVCSDRLQAGAQRHGHHWGIPVLDDDAAVVGVAPRAVHAVELHDAHALPQRARDRAHGRLAVELVAPDVGVVR